MGVWSGRVLPFLASYIWSFSIPQSMSFRRSLRRLAVVLAFGASSIFWKATAMIIRAQMLMYGREAQSKTKTASPATIPKSGERNRKNRSRMLYYNPNLNSGELA